MMSPNAENENGFDFERLKNLYDECEKKNEDALCSHVLSMIRMLNGLCHMYYTDFHYYEKQMFWNPMKIFVEQFIGQVNCALLQENTVTKKEIIMDLEDALYRVLQVYRDLVDSKENGDRQTSGSWAINTNSYDLSPKWCSYYSNILSSLVEIFDKDHNQYAFILYPTLESNTHFYTLLKTRKESGKTAIVYIPEYMIESVDSIPVFLAHEAFHVLTREKKNMQLRAVLMFGNIMEAIELYIFRNVDLADTYDENQSEEDQKEKDDSLSERLRRRLMEIWFSDTKRDIKEYIGNAGTDRQLYSDEFTGKIEEKIVASLRKKILDLSQDLASVYFKECDEEYVIYAKKFSKMKETTEQIEKNIIDLLVGTKIHGITQLIADIFREIYADIACVLTTKISYERYEDAFENSKQFSPKDGYSDEGKELRHNLVVDAVAAYMTDDTDGVKESWKNKAKPVEKQENAENIPYRWNTGTFTIEITKGMRDNFASYGNRCAADFVKYLEDISTEEEKKVKLNELRSFFKKDVDDTCAILTEVLSVRAKR